jgi:hypothetical protein
MKERIGEELCTQVQHGLPYAKRKLCSDERCYQQQQDIVFSSSSRRYCIFFIENYMPLNLDF